MSVPATYAKTPDDLQHVSKVVKGYIQYASIITSLVYRVVQLSNLWGFEKIHSIMVAFLGREKRDLRKTVWAGLSSLSRYKQTTPWIAFIKTSNDEAPL